MGYRASAAATLTVCGILASYWLLDSSKISEPSFVLFVIISILVGFSVVWSERLKSVDLRNLRIELEKIETARRDVELRQQEVRRIALAISELVSFISAFHTRLAEEDVHKLETEWIKRKIQCLLEQSTTSAEDKARALRFITQVEDLDKLREMDPQAAESRWREMWQEIRKELAE